MSVFSTTKGHPGVWRNGRWASAATSIPSRRGASTGLQLGSLDQRIIL